MNGMKSDIEIKEHIKKAKEEETLTKKKYNLLCLLIHKVFNNKSGKELFDKLEEMYIKQPVAYHEWSSNKACFREGENNTIRALMAMYKRAEILLQVRK